MTAAVRQDIQGLRGVAVLLVVLWHAEIPRLTAGYVGVDVFFVLSGYLITGLLLREVSSTGRVDFSRFYQRRARRLLPAAGLTLITVALAVRFFAPETRWRSTGGDVIASTFYVENWRLAGQAIDYLEADSPPSALQHYWSLSVEEQFYLVWPGLIALAAVIGSRQPAHVLRRIAGIVVVMCVASFGWSVWRTAESPEQAYFVTTTRVWQLGVGALVAVAAGRASRVRESVRAGLASIGLAAIGVAAFAIPEGAAYPGTWALLPTLGAAALIVGGLPGGTVGGFASRLLRVSPLRFFGDYSYAIYLWHWPFIVIFEARYGPQSWGVLVVLVAVSVPVAVATTHFVENPIRFAPTMQTATAAIATVVITTLGALGGARLLRSTDPVDTDARDTQIEQVTVALQSDDASAAAGFGGQVLRPEPPGTFSLLEESVDDFVPRPGSARTDRPSLLGCAEVEASALIPCVAGDATSDFVVAVIGDSHMEQWLDALDLVARDRGWRLELLTVGGCPYVDVAVVTSGGSERCERVNRHRTEWLEEHPPDVVISSAADRAVADANGDKVTGDGAAGALEQSLARTTSDLVNAGITVVAVSPTPQSGPLDVAECLSLGGAELADCTSDGRVGTALRQAVASIDGAQLVDMNEWICPERPCPPVIGGVLVYRDVSHITNTYALSLVPQLAEALDLAFGDADVG